MAEDARKRCPVCGNLLSLGGYTNGTLIRMPEESATILFCGDCWHEEPLPTPELEETGKVKVSTQT